MSTASKPTILSAHNYPQATSSLDGKRVAMVLFSEYPFDPRPRRAAEALADCGMIVDLICLRGSGQDSKREVFNGVNIRRVPITRRRGGILGYIYQYFAFLLFAGAIFGGRSLRRRYDLVYVHNMPDFLVFSGLIPKMFGAKVLIDLHDPMPELMMTIFDMPREAKSIRLLKRVEKWSLRFADAVVTANHAFARIFSARSCSSNKITVVMNSPDEKIFSFQSPQRRVDALEAITKPFVIMYHGSLVERNGVELAVQALARVRPSIPGAELRIYGGANAFLEKVMDGARKLGLAGAVHYMGAKLAEQIVEAIEQCDVGVIPNQRNIFTELNTPTRIFEYLALGKPVIAPRASGICDYFDENSLVFFELGNAQDLAEKLEYVFRCPDLISEIIKRGQEVHRAHTWRQERLRLTTLVADLLLHDGAKVQAITPITPTTPTSDLTNGPRDRNFDKGSVWK